MRSNNFIILLVIAILLLVGFLYVENQQLKQTIDVLKNQNMMLIDLLKSQNIMLMEILKNTQDSQLNRQTYNGYYDSNYIIGGLILIIVILSISSFFPGPGPGMEPILTQIDNLGKQDSLIIDCVNTQSIEVAKGLDTSFNIVIQKMDNLSVAINDLNTKLLISHIETNPPHLLLGELNHLLEQNALVANLLN